MSLTIPDKGEAESDLQSILFQEYLEVLVAGINGIDCVLSGGAVTAQGTPDMTVAVAKAGVLTNGVLKAVAAANATITTADATNPRLDLVVINSSGTIAVRAGTPSAFDPDFDLAPKPPARSANDVVLAVVYVPAADTTISSAQITDMRVLRTVGPISIANVAPLTVNTDNTIRTFISLTVPNGLFLSGRKIRIQCGGTMLSNSGAATRTLTIVYGGTTMYADATGSFGTTPNPRAWSLDLILTATATNSQALVGRWTLTSTAATATTGVGDAANIGNAYAFQGISAVDSDAADRTLTLQWTMSVSHSSVEIQMDFGTVELL